MARSCWFHMGNWDKGSYSTQVKQRPALTMGHYTVIFISNPEKIPNIWSKHCLGIHLQIAAQLTLENISEVYPVWSDGQPTVMFNIKHRNFILALVKEALPKVEIFLSGRWMIVLLACRWWHGQPYPSVEIKNQPLYRTKCMNSEGLFETHFFFFCPISLPNFSILLFAPWLYFIVGYLYSSYSKSMPW